MVHLIVAAAAFVFLVFPTLASAGDLDFSEDVTLSQDQPSYQWTFEFQAGERILSAAISRGDDIPVRIVVIGPTGSRIVDRSGYKGTDVSFIVQQSGTYWIQILGDVRIRPVPIHVVLHRLPTSQ